jgi:hypothetical protein
MSKGAIEIGIMFYFGGKTSLSLSLSLSLLAYYELGLWDLYSKG